MSTRYVIIDQGYGLAENWVKVKVIKSVLYDDLFTGGEQEALLVELPSKERIFVHFWKDE